MLFLHRSERADGLVVMLGDLLTVPIKDVMAPEVVSVPTRGIERWLTQQLSSRLGASQGRSDGVCANIDFPFPGTLVGNALVAGSGDRPRSDPWAADRSVWPLLQVVEASLDEPWLSSFAAHLRNAAPAGEERWFASVRHMADLFDRYGVHRPQMVRQWAEGREGGVGPDGSWQPSLWRELRLHIGTPSPAERLPEACERLRAGAEVPGLPERLSVFGLTSLPTSYVEVLAALSVRARRAPLPSAPFSRAVGTGLRACRRPRREACAAATTPRPRRPKTRCSPRGDATAARCSSFCCPKQAVNGPMTIVESRPTPCRCSSVSRQMCGPTGHPSELLSQAPTTRGRF